MKKPRRCLNGLAGGTGRLAKNRKLGYLFILIKKESNAFRYLMTSTREVGPSQSDLA